MPLYKQIKKIRYSNKNSGKYDFMKDLTKGSPSKVMISFAVPVALGNIFQLCYSLADTV